MPKELEVIKPKQWTALQLVEKANAQHFQCEKFLGNALIFAKRAGELLNQAKELKEGSWTDLLAAHFKGSPETARVYMKVARDWQCLQIIQCMKQDHLPKASRHSWKS